VSALLERVSVPRRLEATALFVYALVFALLVEYGRPGLGISQGFYLAIVLFALAGGPVSGVAAGVLATLLCAIAAAIHGTFFGEALEPLGIRFASFTLAGFAVGYFARRGRQMLAESLHVLEDVLRVARRDVATGVLAPEGLSARIAQRVDRSAPFAVLVGELTTSSDAARREELRTLAAALDGDSEVARVGALRVAVVTAARSPEDASRIAAELERVLGGVTFGWAFHPLDGDEPLALFGTASERLVEAAVVLVSTG
jgi:GGDEF domain-containing protein